MYTESGFAELIFGTALGGMRSEFPDQYTNSTLAVMSPQIVGAVVDGDTMTGTGFVTNVTSDCQCTTGITANAIVAISTDVDNATATNMMNKLKTASIISMINSVNRTSDDTITITTLFANTNVCGGTEGEFAPLCTTRFTNHRKAEVMATYMTDGTPASIAAKDVTIRKTLDMANTTWLYAAINSMLGDSLDETFSIHSLPSTIPGTMNPLMWWTTPNLLTIDPALLNAGLETMFAMIVRGGVQRTHTVTGNVCGKNIALEGRSKVSMQTYSLQSGVILLAIQIAVSVIALAGFVPWFLSEHPIGPAIRALKEKAYFMTILNSSTNAGLHELCNAQTHQVWQALDNVVRIGESIQTVSEEVGHVSMDRPKLIRSLVNGKKYY